MALTRKFLKAMGIDEEKIEQIIDAHSETVTALKGEIETARQDGDGLQTITKERDGLKKQLETLQAASGDAAKVQAAFDAYKAGVEAEKTGEIKTKAVLKALEDKGIRKAAQAIIKGLDLSALEIDGEQVKGLDAFIAPIIQENDWAIETTTTQGVPPVNPPSGGAKTTYTRADIERMSADEINRNWAAIQASLPTMKGV